MKNPNATVAQFVTLLAAATVWLCNRYGVKLSDQWAILAAGEAITVFLWVGKHGVKAAWQRVWGGANTVWAGPAVKKPADPKP